MTTENQITWIYARLQAHIASSTAHMDARDARVRSGHVGVKFERSARSVGVWISGYMTFAAYEKVQTSNSAPHTPGTRRSALLDALDGKTPGSTTSTPQAGTSTARAPQLLSRSSSTSRPSPVKLEPMNAVIPRKRASDAPDRVIKKEEPLEGTVPTFSTPTAKRLKSETNWSPKTPLGLANRVPSLSSANQSSKPSMDIVEVAEIRLKIRDVQLEIGRTQAALAKAQRKLNKSTADMTRINKLERDLRELALKKEQYTASIPAITSSPRKPAVQNNQTHSVPSGSNDQLPPAFHNFAFGGPIVQHVAPPNQAFHNPRFAQPNVPVHNVPVVQRNTVASGSNVKVETQAEAVRSEMNGLKPAFDFQRITAGIPGMPAPLSDDERFDDDGDFFGRGKDMFAGPIAKVDE